MKIVSTGTGNGTHVLHDDGTPIDFGTSGLSRIEISPITPNGIITAVMTFDLVSLDIIAQDTKPKPTA